MINVLDSLNCSAAYESADRANLSPSLRVIDAIGQTAQTLILLSYCVEALWGGHLRAVLAIFAEPIYTSKVYCVDLTLETPAPSGLPDELPTDWVKSD